METRKNNQYIFSTSTNFTYFHIHNEANVVPIIHSYEIKNEIWNTIPINGILIKYTVVIIAKKTSFDHSEQTNLVITSERSEWSFY